jgi:uncharacterized RDD family membrane protein YckC
MELAYESGELVSQTPPPDGWGTPQPPDQPSGYPPPPGYQAPPGYQPPPPGYQAPPSYQPPAPPNYPPPSYPPPYGGTGLPTPPPVESYGQPGGYGYNSTAGSLAGWWRRVGATVLDGLIVGIPTEIIFAVAGVSSVGRDGLEQVVLFIYVLLLIGGTGARTVGNMAVGTRVVDAATGAPPGYGKAAVRAVVALVLNITVIGGILDALWPLWDARNQTIHDKAAGTLVLRT